jgi:hypothetical protein
MIKQYSITGATWTPISSAGQSGTCWLDEQNDGAEGTVDVRIWHASVPTDDDVTKGKRCYKPSGNDDMMIITADSGTDIYYARCANVNDKATISVDVI